MKHSLVPQQMLMLQNDYWIWFYSEHTALSANTEQLYLPMNTIVNGRLLGDVPARVYGGATLVPGVHGGALNFDGTGGWADIGDHGYTLNLTFISPRVFKPKAVVVFPNCVSSYQKLVRE